MRKNKKGFTLIELIAVLVIMAIIALIVTPLVMNIVKKAKNSANKRSVDAYGKAVELAVATYLLDNGDYPDTLDNLAVEHSGNEVVCNVKTLNSDGSVYLSGCSVKGTEVKDSKTQDGYYHYGKTTATGPIVYQAYNIGDTVTYNGINFYVIADSDETSDSVTLLKAEPLTVDEVNTYGVGHVNMHVTSGDSFYQTAYDYNGYGGMAYYSSSNCGFDGSNSVESGCTTNYEESEVKYVVDAWANAKIESDVLEEARLITYDEIKNSFEITIEKPCGDGCGVILEKISSDASWMYNSNYAYWTMSQYNDNLSSVWTVSTNGSLDGISVYQSVGGHFSVVRPVITLSKSAL